MKYVLGVDGDRDYMLTFESATLAAAVENATAAMAQTGGDAGCLMAHAASGVAHVVAMLGQDSVRVWPIKEGV